jgi:ABC-type sulfate/molybdate transport systems ATPase subunit
MSDSDKSTGSVLVDARLQKRLPSRAGEQPFTLDLHLRAGRGITALLGPSGSGKTLSLNCLAGFSRPDAGRILVNEQIYFDAEARVSIPPQRRACAYIFQDHALFPHMTVRENLRFAASVGPVRKARALVLHRRLSELLDAFELGPLANRYPAQLSGGQRQRAALARILVNEPRILLLDEPTRGLDERLRRVFYDVLRDTLNRLTIPMLLVSHDIAECFAISDAIYLLDGGRVMQAGTPEDVLTRPANAEAARFFGSHALIPAVILALDPGRNTSMLQVVDQKVQGPYLPGRLLGDSGLLCIRSSDLTGSLSPAITGWNELVLQPRSTSLTPAGMYITFGEGFSITVPTAVFKGTQNSDRMTLYFPKTAVTFVAGP